MANSLSFITEEMGTHEITRIHWRRKAFSAGWGDNMIGGGKILTVHYVTTEGLTITFTNGATLFMPGAHCQATWTV